MNDDLLSMWTEINATYFDGELAPISNIDWHPLRGDEGIGAFAVYLPFAHSIAIDESFRPDPEAIKAGDNAEGDKLEVAYRLVIHEMIHQLLYQRKAGHPGGHGPSFVAAAAPIADKLGIPAPTEQDASRWPRLPEHFPPSAPETAG